MEGTSEPPTSSHTTLAPVTAMLKVREDLDETGFATGDDSIILGKAKKCRGCISPASSCKFRKIYFAASRNAFILS
jgi:hypothetical protein